VEIDLDGLEDWARNQQQDCSCVSCADLGDIVQELIQHVKLQQAKIEALAEQADSVDNRTAGLIVLGGTNNGK
jgi:hypothetical protein